MVDFGGDWFWSAVEQINIEAQQKPPGSFEQEREVVAGICQDGIDNAALGSCEIIASHAVLGHDVPPLGSASLSCPA